MRPPRTPCWSVVLPVKPLHLAKTRLAVPDDLRAGLVLAMAVDTATAALACPAVAQVVVVTDDPRAREAMQEVGAVVVGDVPDAGLNPALVHGAHEATARRPDCGVATLSADLPALRPEELETALRRAADHQRAMVADSSGDGTTMLTARAGVALAPAYGEGSRLRHVAADHAVIDSTDIPTVRQDVDTLDDLVAVARLGAGRRTTEALRGLRRALR